MGTSLCRDPHPWQEGACPSISSPCHICVMRRHFEQNNHRGNLSYGRETEDWEKPSAIAGGWRSSFTPSASDSLSASSLEATLPHIEISQATNDSPLNPYIDPTPKGTIDCDMRTERSTIVTPRFSANIDRNVWLHAAHAPGHRPASARGLGTSNQIVITPAWGVIEQRFPPR